MRVAFVWYWERASEIFYQWRDGYRAAIELINKKHSVSWFLDKAVPEPGDNFDFIWLWGDSNCPFIDRLDQYPARKGISLTTDPHNMENLKKFDVVFVESDPIYKACQPHVRRVIKAFGTDSDFYAPDEKVQRDIEFFYPATFSPWKRQSEIAHLGDKLLCVGTVQPDGQQELEACQKAGVKVEIGYFPAEKIRDYYRRAKHVIIPAIHGSERTVLEAMSMNIVPMVTNEVNTRTRSYLEEFMAGDCLSLREFIEKNYSHYHFAENLLKGIENA